MTSGQRVLGVTDRAAPLWLRALFALQRRLYGAVLEPTRVWARAPSAMRGFVHLFAAVDRAGSPIEPPLRSLVTVKVSQVNACAFCIDINASLLEKRLEKRGASIDKALALESYASSKLFTAKERVALDYAVAMSSAPALVDDALFARLREHFDDDAIVELTALIALQNASAKFNSALAIPAQGFCPAMAPTPADRDR